MKSSVEGRLGRQARRTANSMHRHLPTSTNSGASSTRSSRRGRNWTAAIGGWPFRRSLRLLPFWASKAPPQSRRGSLPAFPPRRLPYGAENQWPLDEAAKKALRDRARKVWARSNEVEARELDAHVHHSDPLQWAHLKPDADPNRLANLWALSPEEHAIANRAWSAFERALNGRKPTPAEVMEAKLRIDPAGGSACS